MNTSPKSAENDLVIENEQLRFALEAAGIGTWDYNLVTGLVQWSGICKMLFGLSPDADITAAILLAQVHPDDRERVARANALALNPDNTLEHHVVFRTLHRDQELRWVQARGKTIRDEQGRLLRFSGIVQEITQSVLAQQTLNQSEARQAFLLKLSDRLRPLADPGEIQYQAACVLGEFIGANRVGYAEDQGDGQTIVVTRNYTHGVPDLAGRYQYTDYGPTLLADFQAGRTVVRNDIVNDPELSDEEKKAHAVLQLGATVNKPLTKNGRLVAVLFIHFQDAHAFSAQELDLLDEVAERTWAALERVRSEDALRQSEIRHRTLFDSIDEAFCVMEVLYDEQGKAVDLLYLQTNRAFERQTGVPDCVGRTAHEVLPGLEPFWIEVYAKVVETGEAVRFQNYVRGINHWFDVYASRFGDSDSRKVAVVFNDITDRRQAEIDLRESEERFRLFVTASADVVYKMSADWRQLNNLVGKTFLADTREPSRDWLLKYILPEDQAQLEATIEQTIATRSIFELEHRVIQADGTVGWTFSRAVPMLDEQGQIIEWFGTASDVTERKRTEEALRVSEEKYRLLSEELDQLVQQRTRELEKTVQDLQRSNSNLQQFAYVASHDLQEPLRKIQSFSSLLQQQLGHELSDWGLDMLRRMESAGERMSTLIRDLLEYSRISTRQQQFEPISLGEVMEKVLQTLEWQLEKTGADLQIDPLPTLNGDERQLGQLFQNLLSNSLKFTQPNEPPRIRITVEQISADLIPDVVKPTSAASAFYQICVIDQGIGFDNKYQDRVFQLFQRLHGRSEYAGTGIGLAICQRVVENHGGAITANSQPGQGTTFCVYLPRQN